MASHREDRTSEDVLGRSQRVKQILEDETFQEEVEEFLETAKTAWLQSASHEWQERERLWDQVNALQAFLAHMRGAVQAGEVEQKRLERKARGGLFR